MFFFGILGILQVLIIPGIIFIHYLRFPKRFPEKMIAVIVSSLVLNYLLVFALTVCRIYVRPVLIVILLAEIGMIGWIYRREFSQPLENSVGGFLTFCSRFIQRFGGIFTRKTGESALDTLVRGIYNVFCIFLALVSLNWIWKLFTWNLGSTFDSYDTVAEWNRWAMDWAANSLPTGTWRYPQLLPTNWSLIYVLMGNTTLQFFAKSFMPLFTLFILGMILDLAYRKRNAGYLIGMAVTYLTLKKFMGAFLIEGLADMPCAFLAFSAVYFLINHQPHAGERKFEKATVLILMAAAGTAVTKQVGVEFLGLFCLLYLLFYIKPVFGLDKRQGSRNFWLAVIIVLVIVAPWYGYKQVMIGRGVEKSEMGMIMQATEYTFRTSDVLTRFEDIQQSMGKYIYIFALIIPFTLFMDPLTRGINLIVALPLFLSWGFLASYDFRNLSIALPIFGMSTGLYMDFLVEKLLSLLRKIHFEKGKLFLYFAAIFALLFAAGMFFFPDELLYHHHNEEVLKTFSPAINQKLEKALSNEQGDFKILTNYPLDYLPGMDGKKAITAFNDYSSYRYAVTKGGVNYVLVPNNADQQILDDIAQRIKSGEYRLVFADDSWIPYQFVKVGSSR